MELTGLMPLNLSSQKLNEQVFVRVNASTGKELWLHKLKNK